MTDRRRVVAVFGYSRGRGDELHPICAERLAHAERLSEGAEAVVLSGWARRRHAQPEAELMRAAWTGPQVPLILDPDARWTAENALNAVRHAREAQADELLIVTSSWHRRRAGILARAASGDVPVDVVSAPGRRRPLLAAREVLCFAVLPLQLVWARRAAKP